MVGRIIDLLEADDGSPAPGEGNDEPAVGEEDLGPASAGEQASAEQGTEPSAVPDLEEMPAEEDTAEGNSGWLFTLGSLVVGDFGAEFEDRSFSRPVQSGLESTNLTVSDFSSEPGATFSFELDTAITSGGRVDASGVQRLDISKGCLDDRTDGPTIPGRARKRREMNHADQGTVELERMNHNFLLRRLGRFAPSSI